MGFSHYCPQILSAKKRDCLEIRKHEDRCEATLFQKTLE